MTMNSNVIRSHYLAAAASILLICLASLDAAWAAKKRFTTTVYRPAEINLNAFPKLAIGNIDGNRGADLADGLTGAVFESQRFEVLDRQHLSRIMDEHDFILAAGDQNSVQQLGQFLGASALVVGRASDVHDITSVTYENVPYSVFINGAWYNRTKRVYTRESTAYITANLRVIDTSNGRVIATKTIPTQYTAHARQDHSAPARIDPTNLYRKCREEIVATFMRMIAPYNETVGFFIEREKKIGSMTQGVNMAIISSWREAEISFKKALQEALGNKKIMKKPKTLAKFYYNLGLACLFNDKPAEADKHLARAFSLNPDKEYAKQIEASRRRHEDLRKMKEQGLL